MLHLSQRWWIYGRRYRRVAALAIMFLFFFFYRNDAGADTTSNDRALWGHIKKAASLTVKTRITATAAKFLHYTGRDLVMLVCMHPRWFLFLHNGPASGPSTMRRESC